MAKIEVIVTDMGNGMSYCGNCGCDLDHGNPLVEIPDKCPDCQELLETGSTYINQGGSDF